MKSLSFYTFTDSLLLRAFFVNVFRVKAFTISVCMSGKSQGNEPPHSNPTSTISRVLYTTCKMCTQRIYIHFVCELSATLYHILVRLYKLNAKWKRKSFGALLASLFAVWVVGRNVLFDQTHTQNRARLLRECRFFMSTTYSAAAYYLLSMLRLWHD